MNDAKEVALEVTPLGPFERWEDAWATLPAGGRGWVMRPDAVLEFEVGAAARFLAAEVAHGPTSVHVRFDGERWRAWKYVERPGTTDRKLIRTYDPVEATHSRPPGALIYAEYWRRTPDPIDQRVQVWAPFVSRFLGFETREA